MTPDKIIRAENGKARGNRARDRWIIMSVGSARPPLAEIPAEPRRPRRARMLRVHQVIAHGVLEHALDIVARLADRARFDPVDDIDGALARIAIGGEPFVHIARA